MPRLHQLLAAASGVFRGSSSGSSSATSSATWLVILVLVSFGNAHGADYYRDDGPPKNLEQVDLASIPDAVPRPEPLAKTGNQPYEALGKRYVPMASARGFAQIGVASWYGRMFHGRRTSSGETYDMYAMTAAHPTLPLPTYLTVVNLDNNRSVVVKVNDRGPFLHNRILDLSYVAAAKLGIAARGTGRVHIKAINQALTQQPALTSRDANDVGNVQASDNANLQISKDITIKHIKKVNGVTVVQEAREKKQTNRITEANAGSNTASSQSFFIQAGAFGVSSNATTLKSRLQSLGFDNVNVVTTQSKKGELHIVRVGPVDGMTAATEQADAMMRSLGMEPQIIAARN